MKFYRSMRDNSRYLIIICLFICLGSFAVYGQSTSVYLETRVLYNFETLDEWQPISNGSRFMFTGDRTNENGVVMKYPNMRLFATKPFGMGNQGYNSTNSLSVSVSFFRKGYNFFDLVPTVQKIIPGKAQTFDVWVWGGNYDYTMEMLFEDYRGYTYTLPIGSLKYIGWKNLSTSVPAFLPQEEPYVPRAKGLRFLNFRFWASPEERADNFVVLLDYFQTVTDTFREAYDGSDIETTLGQEIGGSSAEQYSEGGAKVVGEDGGTTTTTGDTTQQEVQQ
ncbi:flagellar filament protein FlaA [Brachyspira pilosicoli]|uniref:flagellar filament outer layer protein FlaA n=1 Tax=Brachyspira pilosicoli TaxID=52584 RepID=UPI001CA59184|nr:flagellar filament outer layer protein FlaA [Brachyspira pilosicoli]MBW5399059.1 flagellar filament protein FlaA [Brachyspira pilosicoli]